MDGAEIALKMEKGMLESNVIANGEGSVVDVHGFANAKVELKSMHFQRNRGRAVEIYSGNSLELKIAKSEFSYHKIYQWDGGAVLVSILRRKLLLPWSDQNFVRILQEMEEHALSSTYFLWYWI